MCGRGARQRGDRVVGRVEEGMEVLVCVCVKVCVCASRFVCVCVSRESSGEGDELEMQEVYRLAKCRG